MTEPLPELLDSARTMLAKHPEGLTAREVGPLLRLAYFRGYVDAIDAREDMTPDDAQKDAA